MTFTTTPFALAAAAVLSLALSPSQAAETAVKPGAAKAAATKPAPAKAAQARSTARAGKLAEDTVEQVNAAQLQVADRVLTGTADCEFNQKIDIQPREGHAGHFHVMHNKVRYTMVPQETTTGAVRLEDKRAGVVWLQIPSKSMLMNAKIGQRMVDGCTLSEQRAAVNAVTGATGIGIVPPVVSPETSAMTPVPAPAPAPAPAASAAQ